MQARQATLQADTLKLHSERLGALPLINHFIERLDLEAHLDAFVPSWDRRIRLPYAKALGMRVRSLLIEREPMYRQHESVSTFAPAAFGLEGTLVESLSDDAIGRALDRLFDADRAVLLTACVVSAVEHFDLELAELHNDSTTVRFCGRYAQARGRRLRAKRAPFVTYGHSKDHRPDLKPLRFILTTSEDGGAPVQFRCEAGNRNDSPTHIESWEALRRAAGRSDFLYVRRLQAVRARAHGSHRAPGRAIRVRDAAHPPRGWRVPRVDPNPRARLGAGAR